MLAFSVAGCTTDGQPMGSFAATAAAPHGATIAFESIDGAPPTVFRKLVQNLEAEAAARQVAVVSREGAAHYRIRGYLAAQVERREAAFAWVWDVYDTDKRRALRITGEERAGSAGRDAWAAADEEVLRRMARAGMSELAMFLTTAPGAPGGDGPVMTVAGVHDDFSPETADIRRLPGSIAPTAERGSRTEPTPTRSGFAGGAALAYRP
jgi:hypothetical protein